MTDQPYRLILASGSPRRLEILRLGGWEFEVAPAEIDESPLAGEDPRAYVLRLSEAKARAVADFIRGLPGPPDPRDAVVLAADTTVVDDAPSGDAPSGDAPSGDAPNGDAPTGPEILAKPLDDADAVRMLKQLRGRTHQVLTGVTALRLSDGQALSDVCATAVPMRAYTDAEIEAYVLSGDPLDKAGAYAIQSIDFHPVESLTGCYANVVGLPLCDAGRLLSQLGLPPTTAIAQASINADGIVHCPACQAMRADGI